MKKRKVLLAALLICLSVSLQANAAEQHKVDVGTQVDQDYSNYKDTTGGAVYNSANQTSSVTNSTFTNNTAENSGGAVYNQGNMTVGGTFDNNSARYSGGAIHNYKGNLTVEDGSTFSNNKTLWAPDRTDDYPKRASEMGTIYSEGTSDTTAKVHIGKNVTFENNQAGAGAGLYLYGNNEATIGEGVIFKGNKALEDPNKAGGDGGAISIVTGQSNGKPKLDIGANATFENNEGAWGGAICVAKEDSSGADAELNIGENSVFRGNKATGTETAYGGAIYNWGSTTIGQNALFDGNSADKFGGAIYNASKIKLTESNFIHNSSQRGGAIYGRKDSTTTAQNVTFSGNTVTGSYDADGNPIYGQGGAIFTDRGSKELNVDGSVFDGNSAQNEGGAIWSGSTTNIKNSKFTNNSTTGTEFAKGTEGQPDYKRDAEGGGAIFVGSNSTANIETSEFTGNTSATVGGAIATRSNAGESAANLTVKESTFNGNSAAKNGGAIASYVDAVITDTSFTGNKAGDKGGAVWANGDVTVKAENNDVVFSGNSAADGSDIFMDNIDVQTGKTKAMGQLTLNAEKNITFEDGISGADEYTVTKDGAGTLTFNGEIKNAQMQVSNGTLHLAEGNSLNNSKITMKDGTTLDTTDNAFTSYTQGEIETEGDINLKADISSATGKSDSFAGIKDGSTVTLLDFNPVGDTLLSSGSITLDELKKSLGLSETTSLDLGEDAQKDHKFLSPLRWLNAKADGDLISFNPTGNSYKDFNPAVMAAPVAAQIGGYLNQLNSYDEAFRNMDMYMLMTKAQRQALKNRNKYAAADSNLVFDPTNTPYDNASAWFRPYATFENVKLKGGPKVSNVAWGSFFGADSELIDLGHGWDGMFGAYLGYNGSHQAYNGIDIYQNGATLGLVGMAYKDNFFAGLTANVGSNIANADTNYGSDDFTLLMSGIAAKTGYNWELADGRFIIQPNYMMSYSFVNTFDYTNAAGLRVNSDPLHAITFEPGVKFIGNLNNGWQPYAGVSVVWNVMDKTQFQASDATLPELSVKPFVKYGLGIRKTWGERLTGFFQTFFTSGGRNGIGLQAGLRWTLGKSEPKHANSTGEKKYIKANANTQNNIM